MIVANWIEAVATAVGALAAIGAFIAAIKAARWTASTAVAAQEQVKAAQAQATAARDQVTQSEAAAQAQLTSMREQLELAKQEADSGQGRFLRTQLDALAPVVYARAVRPHLAVMHLGDYRAKPDALYAPENGVTNHLEVKSNEQALFGITFVIEIVNCGDKPARIDFIERTNADLVDLPQGQEIILPPHEKKDVVWRRQVLSDELHEEKHINAPEIALGQVMFWVRDLGMTVRDTHALNLDLRYFSLDGSRLLAKPEPTFPWTEKYAGQIPPRRYERLEAAEANGASSS